MHRIYFKLCDYEMIPFFMVVNNTACVCDINKYLLYNSNVLRNRTDLFI